MTSESQIRATFKDTKNAQEKLRVKLDFLDENNTCIKDKKEYFNLLNDALLGMEYEKECKLFLPGSNVLMVFNLGRIIRHIAYIPNSQVTSTFFRKYNKVVHENIEIGSLWNELKFEIFGIYPAAIAMSIRISKEQTRYSGSDEVTSYDEVRGEQT